MKICSLLLTALAASVVTLGIEANCAAQSQDAPEVARQLAPTGTLRVGVLMLSYFVRDQENFAADVKASGVLQQALDRMGDKAEGVVVTR